MPEGTLLHQIVSESFKPKIIEDEKILNHIFLGLFGFFISVIFIFIFGTSGMFSPLNLELGMYVSYASTFIFLIFTLYYSLPLLDHIDDEIGKKGISMLIRVLSLIIFAALLFFIWPVIATFVSISREINLLVSQKEFISLIISFFALLSIVIPNYYSNQIFKNYKFTIQVEEK